jgi:hypothetical protein
MVNFIDVEIPSIELRSALDGVARRWWVVASCMLIAVVLVFVQQSGPGSRGEGTSLVLERRYEAVIETDELNVVKIDPSAIVPVPSFDNQLSIISADETSEKLRRQTQTDAVVEVTRSEPKFTLTDSLDEGNNRISFLSTGTPSYAFRCIGKDVDSCTRLIDAYVSMTIELRRESVLGGLEGGLTLLASLIEAAEERIALPALSEAQRTAEITELASLLTKRDALELIGSKITGKLILIDEGSLSAPAVPRSEMVSSYVFGLAVGLVIGILLALQLAVMDKRVRHGWQVRSVGRGASLIGSPVASDSSSQAIALASSLSQAHRSGAETTLLIELGPELRSFSEQILNNVDQTRVVVIDDVNAITADQLIGNETRSVLILAKAGRTTRGQLAESIGLVTAGRRGLIGIALIR